MRKIVLFAVIFMSALAEASSWPVDQCDSYQAIFPNPELKGQEFIQTRTYKKQKGTDIVPLLTTPVQSGQSIDALGGLATYMTYTSCFIEVRESGYQEMTLNAGLRYTTTHNICPADLYDAEKRVVKNGSTYTERIDVYDFKDVNQRQLDFCQAHATASVINPGYCRFLNVQLDFGLELLDHRLVRLKCERRSTVVYESNEAQFEVAPALVKKLYSLSNGEGVALLKSVGFKHIKSETE